MAQNNTKTPFEVINEATGLAGSGAFSGINDARQKAVLENARRAAKGQMSTQSNTASGMASSTPQMTQDNMTRMPQTTTPQTASTARATGSSPAVTPAVTPVAAPTPAPEATPSTPRGADVFMQQLKANADDLSNWDKARRRQFVERIAISSGDPGFAGSDQAAEFVQGNITLDSNGNVVRTSPSAVLERRQRESGVVTDEAAIQFMNEASSEISNRLSEIDTPEYESPEDAEIRELFDRRRELTEAEFNQMIEGIRAEYAAKRVATEQLNRDLVGGTQSFIGRAGSFSSASGQGAISRELIAADSRMNALLAEERQALLMAQSAKTEGDLAALNSFLNQANAARQERNSIAQQEFQDKLTATEAARQNRADDLSNASSVFSFLQTLTPEQMDELDPAYVSGIEQDLQMPQGFMKSFAENIRNANEAATEEAQFNATMKILELAKDIPAGFSFQIGDEVYTGLKGGGGKSYMVDNGLGTMSFVTLDEDSGELVNTFQLPIGAVKNVVSSTRRAGGFTDRGANIDSQFLIYGTAASQLNGTRPLSELYASVGMEVPEGIDGTRITTTSDILQIADAIGILPDTQSTDWARVASLVDPSYDTDTVKNDDGTVSLIKTPKYGNPTPENTTMFKVTPEASEEVERSGILKTIAGGLGSFFGFN